MESQRLLLRSMQNILWIKMNIDTLREYIKIHKISLAQDWDDAINNIELIDSEYHPSDDYFEGAIDTCNHLLEYINEQ